MTKMLWCGCPVQAIESTKIEKEKGILRGVHVLRRDSLLSVDSKSTPVFTVKNRHTRHEQGQNLLKFRLHYLSLCGIYVHIRPTYTEGKAMGNTSAPVSRVSHRNGEHLGLISGGVLECYMYNSYFQCGEGDSKYMTASPTVVNFVP